MGYIVLSWFYKGVYSSRVFQSPIENAPMLLVGDRFDKELVGSRAGYSVAPVFPVWLEGH